MITFLGLLFDFPPIIERMIHAYNLSVSGFEEVDEEMENVPSIASLPNRILKEAAAAFGSIKVFNSLLTRCPLSLPHPGARGFNLAFYLAHFTFQPEILKVFLDLGFKPNLFPYMFDDPPDWVVLVGPRESSIIIRPLESISTPRVLATIRLLIDYGADVNQLSSSGTTALWSAVAMYESQEIFEDLLRHGADPLAGSDPSLTALHSAITSRDFNLVRLFLEALSLRGRPLEHASFFLDAARVECEDNDDICGARISAAASVLRVPTHYHWRQIYPVPADPPSEN
ncbi:hypothetical protein N7539_000025 [Penicillium diatomitis]|uniref:Ankyrin n=1 Tax=Penicillium diatomitis TaxID=2819901 RepID=A0A9W9XL03_9EURO|nr:uncharacterized protein N7539_000025 [Penicillium diatomitis]KAJ5494909.1 hypothetical protein N7539_000025 [Penicillium diatomitis]